VTREIPDGPPGISRPASRRRSRRRPNRTGGTGSIRRSDRLRGRSRLLRSPPACAR